MLDYFINSGLWIQLFGAMGYAMVVSAGFLQNRTVILCFELAGCGVVAAHWLLLGTPELAMSNLVFMYAIATGIFVDRLAHGRLISLLSVPMMLALVLSCGVESYGYTLLVLAGSALGLYARSCADLKKLRIYGMSGSFLWFFINSFAGSVPGALCALGYCFSHGRSLYRVFKGNTNMSSSVLA